jgi:predicted enzyme related to lactoylglutathione lyase
MSERSDYKPGEFCWVNLLTTDIDAAVGFYRDLIGWEFEQAPGPVEETQGFGFFTYKGKLVAGGGSVAREGQQPVWVSHIKVDDVEAAAAKVEEAGGTVLVEPFDILGEAGRMAICQDAEGAAFSILQLNKHRGAELVNEIGAWTWNQLATRDLDGAKRFYGDVFGWTLEQNAEAAEAGVPFYMWQVEGQKWEEGLAGAMIMGADDMPPDTPPHWMVYFCVADANKTIEQVNGSGGTTLFGPQRIPVGELAVFTDPHGAAFAIIEPDYPESR